MKKRTVLFVDDDERVLTSLRRGLIDEPYERLFANSGFRAVGLLLAHTVHVLVTDLRMPDMSGLELLEIAAADYPDVIPLILSGQPTLESAEASSIVQGVHRGAIFTFLAKPWDLDGQLKKAVRQALACHKTCIQEDQEPSTASAMHT